MNLLNKDKYIHMPELFERLIATNIKAMRFLIYKYIVDTSHLKTLEEAYTSWNNIM